MATSRRGTARTVDHSTPQRLGLLKHLVLSSLPYSRLTALFFAERLHALDPAREESVYLYALTLHRLDRHHEAIWLLRQSVVVTPASASADYLLDQQQQQSSSYASSSTTTLLPQTQAAPTTRNKAKLSRPANEASLRSVRLYAACCLAASRAKEGRTLLAKALAPSTAFPISPEHAPDLMAASVFHPETEPWVHELELARLSTAAGERERATLAFQKALEGNPWCWEALDSLCALGQPPDTEVLFPPRPKSVALPVGGSPGPQMQHASQPQSSQAPTSKTHPAPLGPSQTSAVNSFQPFMAGAKRAFVGQQQDWAPSELVTPVGPVAGLRAAKEKPALAFGGGLGIVAGGWKKNAGKGYDLGDLSMDADSSFGDTSHSFYPTQHQPPPPFSYIQNHTASVLPPAFSNAHASGSSSNAYNSAASLFTPPTNSLAAPAPGVKRARGQQPPISSGIPAEDDSRTTVGGRRVVRGVPTEKSSKPSRDSSVGAPTRRSSRLSSAASNSTTTPAQGGAGSSSSMTMSRSQSAQSSKLSLGPTTRDKKRTKSGAGPSVLSDAGSEALSPQSHSSSVPSSPQPFSSSSGQAQQQQHHVVDPAALEAEDYVAACLRGFGRARVAEARYESGKALDALNALPVEQQKGARCLLAMGRSYMEMLSYEKAERAFMAARQASPHLLESMEHYSTLLWHLRLPTQLSFLAQDLMLLAPKAAPTWIAAGNVFSHLEDHASALKCFKRAAQVEEACAYAYTLSGHECVALEEWERALGFFREAVRLDERHYNAWFGLGNVYMQTGKYRLAEYHFRKACDINPSNASLVCCVGTVLEKLGQRKEALEQYERACLLAPESPAVRFKRVRLLIGLKQYQLAETDLLALKDRAPNEFNVYFLLGKLYKLLGRKADMLKYFGLAQDLEPRTAALIRETISREKREAQQQQQQQQHLANASGVSSAAGGMEVE